MPAQKTQNKTPRVSVLTPVYNVGPFLEETIRSVLGQTFADFEYILCDDGSTDNSLEIARSFDDPRIRLIANEQNMGSPVTRNKLIQEATGEFCAILDSDDLMFPYRLQAQVEFLDSRPDVDVCSGAYTVIDDNGVQTDGPLNVHNMDHEQIKIRSLFLCAVAQTTLMFRRERFVDTGCGYIIRRNGADDMGMYSRAIDALTFNNIEIPLTMYRARMGQMSSTIRSDQYFNAVESMCYRYERLGMTLDDKEISILKGLHISALHKEQMPDLYRFIARLLRYNEMQKQYDQKRLFDCLMDFHRRYRTMAKYGEKKWLRRKIFTLRDRLFQMRMKKYDK